MKTNPAKTHQAVMRIGQRVWAKILKTNRYETAGSRAAGVLRGHVPWPWERDFERNHRPFDIGTAWSTLPAVERLKLSLMPREILERMEFFAWGPGSRPWIGKPGKSTLNSGMLERVD